MSSTGTSLIPRMHGKTISDVLCKKFNVKKIVQSQTISKETKAEAFLLGAVFGEDTIGGDVFRYMIFKDTLYLDRHEH